MIKTLSKAQKMEREKFRIPRSVQDAIPIRRIFADGIFQVGNQYSKTWSFTDINYAIASKEDKTAMFLDYSELLNALDSGASAKITIYNRRINKAEFEKSVLLPDKADGLDEYRHEFNKMLTAQVTGTSNSIWLTAKSSSTATPKRSTPRHASTCVSFLRCAGSRRTGWTRCCLTGCGKSKPCARSPPKAPLC